MSSCLGAAKHRPDSAKHSMRLDEMSACFSSTAPLIVRGLLQHVRTLGYHDEG